MLNGSMSFPSWMATSAGLLSRIMRPICRVSRCCIRNSAAMAPTMPTPGKPLMTIGDLGFWLRITSIGHVLLKVFYIVCGAAFWHAKIYIVAPIPTRKK